MAAAMAPQPYRKPSLALPVVGVDTAQNIVEADNRPANAERLTNCAFQEGDAQKGDANDLHELRD